MFFPFLPGSACFFLHRSEAGKNKLILVKGTERRPKDGWQGERESAVSAKRGWFQFGAKAAQSEAPARAAAKRGPTRQRAEWEEDCVVYNFAVARVCTL